MTDSKRGEYEVGKGRPPRHSRFKPGQSGNPKGRAKKTRNLATDLTEELSERIQVREGGHARSMSKQRALLKTLFAKALQGDARSASLLIALIARHIKDDEAPAAQPQLGADDEALLEEFLERRLGDIKKRAEPAENLGEQDD
jgi:hypothetical protein